MLSKREAHKLLRSVQFPGEETYVRDVQLASSSKSHRRKLIRQDGISEEKKSAAAIELQRIWRGYVTRCLLFSILNPGLSTHVLNTGSRFQHSERGLRDVLSSPSKSPAKKSSQHISITSPASDEKEVPVKKHGSRERARARLQRYYQKYWEKEDAQPISFEEFCAHFIQNWWYSVRRKLLLPARKTPSGVKSVTIAVSPERSRTIIKPKKKRSYPISREEAASMIQGAWRRHIDQQVYKYYRDLINFRCRGDPSLMLRCINPREAKLLDAAGGIHIKFRLAGDRFPPNIYYKIFTHRNVVDMCANSPKDYTKSGAKRLAAKEVHNRIGDGIPQRGEQCKVEKIGWYQRIENNGWRLVSDRLIIRADQDPVTWETSRKKVDFKHSKLQRREDVARKKRKKKVEWLKKMYQDGMLQSKIGDAGANKLIEGATAGMVDTIEKQGLEAVDDWEVDELLDWTNGLNFDDYLNEWRGIGTSSGSERFVDEKISFKMNFQDPYEFAIGLPRTPTASRTDNDKAPSLPVS
ncbi:protein MFI-like [Amphiura filiformis]|uniref:protein MFI-like n=1 Tax=Amphiura filiformis TaxID=82378 RepID=UPI003B228F42